jgi:lysyl-tRNA synthetase class 1
MGKQPPTGYFYELFLDEEGKKISKSVGKGLTIDTWVHYAPLESLLYYLFQNPRQAKRLYWGVVPKSVDEYLADLQAYPNLPEQKQPDAAAWQIFNKGTDVPQYELSINFSLINNLIFAVARINVEVISEYRNATIRQRKKNVDILRDLDPERHELYRFYSSQ